MADFTFPDDLVQLQRDWLAAERRWWDAAGRGDEAAVAEAYRETHDLTMALHRHPYMQATEHHYQARMALRDAARA